MKTKLVRLTGLVALFLLLLAPNAFAVALTTASPSYVGSITPNVPANPTSEEGYINYLITLAFNTSGSFDGQTMVRSGNLPGLPEAEFSEKSDNDENEFDLVGFTGYILGKYNQDKAGAWVWYLSGFTGDIELPETFNGHDLSHTSFFGSGGTSVPDGGTTAVLLGIGFVGVALAGRRHALIVR